MRLFFILFLCFAKITIQNAYTQTYKNIIQQADSLAELKYFEKSLALYEHFTLQSQEESPKTLLKMASLSEQLQQYPKTLYYLTKTYYIYPNTNISQKIKEITQQYQLKGHIIAEYGTVETLLMQYKALIVAVLVSLSFVLLWGISRNIGRLILICSFLGISLYLNQYTFLNSQAIVYQENTLLYNAPSSGAVMLASIGKGHCLKVINTQDVWLEVIWENQKGYIKKKQTYLIDTI
jgi:tetratricopeptide (TPR) repeat protein